MDDTQIAKRRTLEGRIATATGIIVGAGLTAIGCYRPESTPYFGAVVVAGAVTGAAVVVTESTRFVKRFLAYGVLSSTLVIGGNYLGARRSEVQKAIAAPQSDSLTLTTRDGERKLYLHEGVYLPKDTIINTERAKIETEKERSLKEISDKYNK